MTYAEMLERARAAKTTRELAPAFYKFEGEGDTVVGKLVARALVKSRSNEGTYNDYVVETDDGMVKFHCGNQFDEKVGNALGIGKVYAWTFNGKRSVGKGRTVNDFSCVFVPSESEQYELQGDAENPL